MLRLIPRCTTAFDERAAAALRPYSGVTARLLYSRGMTDFAQAEAFLHPALDQLHDPLLLRGMPEAVQLLARAKSEGLPVVVYGDYDADGVCACALLTQALLRYGVRADPFIPLREKGYGLNTEAVGTLAQKYAVLLTVDLGITNHEEVRLAQSLGMTVIVTDHHGLPLEESPADVVINPLLGGYPFRRLCGTGVAFKLAQALLGLERCLDFMDLAALATVADLVPLTGENRVLVSLGLPVIAGRKRPGMRALLRVSGDPETVDSETLGFRLGPRLNAAGRLSDAGKGVRLLLTEDPEEADRLAAELDLLNTERRAAEAELVQAAEKTAAGHDFISQRALILRGKGWHAGIVGLAAGRLCQKYYCPVCVLSEQDGLLHGSLRSIPGVHIHQCLQRCDDLLLRYGGHEQAAGVTLAVENYDAFCERLQAAVSRTDPAQFTPAQEYDAELTLADCTSALLEELSLMAPFGCGNPPPLFLARGVAPEERRAVGAGGAHLKLALRQGERVMDGIAFSMGALAASMPESVDTVFSLERNVFRGVVSLQMGIKALRPVREARLRALERPDREREQSELLDGLLDALAYQAGKAGSGTECLLESQSGSWEELERALHAGDRGILMVARTRASAARALSLAEMDWETHHPGDPRGFHTLLTAPCIGAVVGGWRQVWLVDGELFPGEAALWRERLPNARVYVGDREALARLASELDAGDAAYRLLYKALKTQAFRSLRQAAEAAHLGGAQARAGMHAFRELGLAAYTESPFSYALCAAAKCRLDDSPLLSAVRSLARSGSAARAALAPASHGKEGCA